MFSSGLGTVVKSLAAIWKSEARSSILLLCLAMVLCQVGSKIISPRFFVVVVVVVVVVVLLLLFCCFVVVDKMPASVHKEGGQQCCLPVY